MSELRFCKVCQKEIPIKFFRIGEGDNKSTCRFHLKERCKELRQAAALSMRDFAGKRRRKYTLRFSNDCGAAERVLIESAFNATESKNIQGFSKRLGFNRSRIDRIIKGYPIENELKQVSELAISRNKI